MPYDYYNYNYGYTGGEEAFAGIAGFLSVFVALYYLLIFGISIAAYVMHALSLYTIAKRRGIHHPWLAWIPVGSSWLLGSISDQYQAVAKKQVRKRRKVLLGLELGLYATIFVMIASILSAAIAEAAVLDTSGAIFGANLAIVLLMFFAFFVLALVTAIFQYIAYYDLFASCDPSNAALFLILSILFGISLPVLLLVSRKKDLGMPPRKKTEAAAVTPACIPVPPATGQAAETAAEEVPVPVTEAPAEETPTEENPTEEVRPE